MAHRTLYSRTYTETRVFTTLLLNTLLHVTAAAAPSQVAVAWRRVCVLGLQGTYQMKEPQQRAQHQWLLASHRVGQRPRSPQGSHCQPVQGYHS